MGAGMRVEEAIGKQLARLRAQRQLSLADLGEALGYYLGKPWSRQAVHQANAASVPSPPPNSPPWP